MTAEPDISAASDSPPIKDLRAAPAVPSGIAAFLDMSAWGQLTFEMMENTPQLQWPQSNWTYHSMRNDSQIDGLISGVIIPALRMRYSISPNGADDNIVTKMADDYNLPIQGSEPEDDVDGFEFGNHLYHALLAIIYGHMYFDEWGLVGDDGLWHIEEMDPIMPQTISQININSRGKLVSVRQFGTGMNMESPDLPEQRIVPYVWQKEGSNWLGRSMLRPLYRDYLIKDRVLRVNAINIERAGAGVPIAESPPGATPEQIAALDALAQAWKVGESAGGAVPNGARMRLMGVEGQQPDAIKTVNYHDEAMARSFLAMLIQLGQTKTGSRALGHTFSDLMEVVLEAVASWAVNRFNKTVLKRDVEWNFGKGTRQPKLVYETFDDPNLAVADFVSLIDKGAIKVDPELRAWVRKKYRLPEELPVANGTGSDAPPPVEDPNAETNPTPGQEGTGQDQEAPVAGA